MALTLPDDVWVHIGLHLKPRHLSKLMRTCKRINRLVDNETYWTRVVVHLALRDNWMFELGPPLGEQLAKPDFLSPQDPCLYYMVGLDRGYYHGMQQFIERISAMFNACILHGDEKERAWAKNKQNLSLREITLDYAMTRWFPEDDSMKGFAKAAMIREWIEDKKRLRDEWPKLQKFLFDLEDDPMPAVFKRRMFRKMLDAFGGSLQLWCGPGDSQSILYDIFIF